MVEANIYQFYQGKEGSWAVTVLLMIELIVV